MIERWEKRWRDNWARYLDLQCLKVIVPWSSAALRFCQSELKRDPLTAALRARFPGETIISVTGIRREESSRRARAPIAAAQPRLTVVSKGTQGIDWNPIADWILADVLAIHERLGFPLHPAYTEFKSSRVSCSFCILATVADQQAALRYTPNRETYRRLCELELISAFAFQEGRWLCDLDPQVFSDVITDGPQRLARAKTIAAARQQLESLLPVDLLYKAGTPWPPRDITEDDGRMLAIVRNSILSLYGIDKPAPAESIVRTLNDRRRLLLTDEKALRRRLRARVIATVGNPNDEAGAPGNIILDVD